MFNKDDDADKAFFDYYFSQTREKQLIIDKLVKNYHLALGCKFEQACRLVHQLLTAKEKDNSTWPPVWLRWN